MKKKTVIFDLDGVLVDRDNFYYHSTHTCNCGLEFSRSSHQDSLNILAYEYYKFFKQRGYPIYIFSTRSEEHKNETIKWLKDYDITFDKLEMRSNNDYRPAYEVKQEFLIKNFPSKAEEHVKAIFDRDEGVIAMYQLFNIKKIYNCKCLTIDP